MRESSGIAAEREKKIVLENEAPGSDPGSLVRSPDLSCRLFRGKSPLYGDPDDATLEY